MNIELLKEQAEQLTELKIILLNNDLKTEEIRDFFSAIKRFYCTYNPDMIYNDLVFIYTDEDLSETYGLSYNVDSEVNYIKGQNRITFPAIVQVFSNGKCYYKDNLKLDKNNYKDFRLIYLLDNIGEHIFSHEKSLLLDRSVLNSRSIFVNPSFRKLEEALEYYYHAFAKQSTCKFLEQSWESKNRIYWKPKPEDSMRDSLWQYLRSSLRGIYELINREKNTSESNPVDISIIWKDINGEALIEVKWLGRSISEEGVITSSYSNSRAVDGAKQLIDYIVECRRQNINQEYKGYLVVFDGRRSKAFDPKSIEKITEEDLWKYKDREIENIPEHFSEFNCNCKRFFMEPLLSEMKFSS